MKKSLIALAVLAASGASFAQVTVTGNLIYGFKSTTTGANNTGAGALISGSSEKSGFGAETARVVFTAKEDLGGGYAATAKMGLNTGAGTTGTANSDDTTLTLVTPVGGLTMGNVRAADYLGGGIAGVDAYNAGSAGNSGWDGSANKIFTTRTFRDFVAFTIPVGAFTFTLSQAEAAGENTFGTGSTGASGGTFGGSDAPITTLSATYAAGPLVANGQYATYKNSGLANGTATIPGVGVVSNPNVKDTTRLSASYDLGMAKLGAGAVISNHTAPTGGPAAKTTDYLIGAKVPMGASSFGVTFASRTYADITPNVSVTGTGYSLEYGYAMSKRTSVIANYARWTSPFLAAFTGNAVVAEASSQYQLLLNHTF